MNPLDCECMTCNVGGGVECIWPDDDAHPRFHLDRLNRAAAVASIDTPGNPVTAEAFDAAVLADADIAV